MIFFKQNAATSDDVSILFYASATSSADNLKIEFIIQYIDTARVMASKNVVTNNTPTSEELLYTYSSKINSILKKINKRTLSSLFNFGMPNLD